MKRLTVSRKRLTVTAVLAVIAVFAVTAVTALAATLSGDGTIIGTTGNDTINAGNQMDTIYGLGGSDNISAGNGKDIIDAGGVCQAGVSSGVYPNGLPSSSYCQHGPHGPCGHDNITAGSSSDTVWGNCGSNTINLGSGGDTVFAYGGPNDVSVGNGADTIYAYGTGNYNTGSGPDVVYAQYSTGDTINCGSTHTTVYAVKGTDYISRNCTIRYVAADTPPGVRQHTTRRTKHHARHHAKRHVTKTRR